MTPLKNKKIGILGGIGPESTANFYFKLIKILQNKNLVSENSDFPQIIINSIPAPELFKGGDSNKNLEIYLSGLKELDKEHPDVIVMVCNTAHVFYEYFQKNITSKILNLVYEVKKSLAEYRSYVVLGSSTTIKKGLYKFNNLNSIPVDEADQIRLDDLIFNYNRGFKRDLQKKYARDIAERYLKNGADCILLACTEVALMLEGDKIPKINTMDILVEALIDYLIKGVKDKNE
jgi:aspartate racemase